MDEKKLDDMLREALKWLTIAEIGFYVSPASMIAATAVEVGGKIWKVLKNTKK